MVYTEIKKRNEKKYYYRVISIRKGKKVSKKRIYLGAGLKKKELEKKEREADKNLLKKENKEINKTLEKIKSKIVPILRKNKIKRAGIFGSYAIGKQKKDSDIDIIVEYPKGMGFRFVGIQFELEKKLGRKVDLVTYKYLNPYIKKYILAEEVKII